MAKEKRIKFDELEESDQKLMLYVVMHYGKRAFTDKELDIAIAKEDFFKMSMKEIKTRYGDLIKENIKKMEEEDDEKDEVC